MIMKIKITALVILLSNILSAQIGINTVAPNTASVLHVQSTNQGILIPRIKLVSTDNPSPLTLPIEEGTIVFNDGVSGVGDNRVFKGFYFWKNSSWNSMLDKSADTDYKAIKFVNKTTSTQNFNGATGNGKEIDVFGDLIFNDDDSVYEKISDQQLRFKQQGKYIVTLNLALVDQISNNQIYSGPDSNTEIYMGFTIFDGTTEKSVGERALTMVPQTIHSGSEFISDTTPDNVNDSSTSALRKQYTRGKFTYTLTSYIDANVGDVLKLRAIQNNTNSDGKGVVSYDPESESSITILKIR